MDGVSAIHGTVDNNCNNLLDKFKHNDDDDDDWHDNVWHSGSNDVVDDNVDGWLK